MITLWLGLALAWEMLGPEGKPTGREVVAKDVFAEGTPLPGAAETSADNRALAEAAAAAGAWFDAHLDDLTTRAGMIGELGVTREQVRRTLSSVEQIAREDAASGRASRLGDADFVAEHFRYLRWTPDPGSSKVTAGETRIRLTRYFVPEVAGCSERSAECPVALHADPGEPWRSRFTRSEVFGGAYEAGEAAGRARALVWLSRERAHDAMMQGTVRVTTERGSRLLNVDVPNGMPYLRGRSSEEQRRLWYFAEVDGVYGWGQRPDKLRIQAMASVAGDVYNLGLGRVVLLDYPDGKGGRTLRPVIVGDTGGAFQPNLGQLDLFAGSFPDRGGLYAATAGIPDRVGAGVLIAR